MKYPLCGVDESRSMDPYVVLIEDAMERAIKSTGSHFASEGEKRSRDGRQQKKWRRDGAVEKDGGGKSKKPTFHPAWKSRKTRGIPLSTASATAGD